MKRKYLIVPLPLAALALMGCSGYAETNDGESYQEEVAVDNATQAATSPFAIPGGTLAISTENAYNSTCANFLTTTGLQWSQNSSEKIWATTNARKLCHVSGDNTGPRECFADIIPGQTLRKTLNGAATTWEWADAAKLCRGARNRSSGYEQPILCYNRLMQGQVNWGGGVGWAYKNAIELCQGSKDATATIDCFKWQLEASGSWSQAVNACKFRFASYQADAAATDGETCSGVDACNDFIAACIGGGGAFEPDGNTGPEGQPAGGECVGCW